MVNIGFKGEVICMSGSKGVFAEAIEKDSNTSPEQGHGFAWEWRAQRDSN